MKRLLGSVIFAFVYAIVSQASADPTGTNAPEYRLTVELRDGSKVMGTAVDENFRFRSELLGKIKLTIKDIRFVECVSSNSAKLATANGDRLTVWFADSSLALKTSFGKIELAVHSLRKFTVATTGIAGARRPGLVALWSGEDDGKDSVGGHDAELTAIHFAEGKVGRAFLLEGDDATIKIPGNPAFNIGSHGGFTLGMWINPADVSKTIRCLNGWKRVFALARNFIFIHPTVGQVCFMR